MNGCLTFISFQKYILSKNGLTHSLFIKNIFQDKMNLRRFYFRVTIYEN